MYVQKWLSDAKHWFQSIKTFFSVCFYYITYQNAPDSVFGFAIYFCSILRKDCALDMYIIGQLFPNTTKEATDLQFA